MAHPLYAALETVGDLSDEEFYDVLVTMCAHYGIISDHTRDMIENVIDSIEKDDVFDDSIPDPFDDFTKEW